MTVTLNAQADALSLSYTPLVSPLAPKCDELPPLEIAPTFTSSVTFETATPGMTIPALLPQTKPPIGLKFFPRSQGAQNLPPGVKPEAAEITGPQGFLMKYWYIMLPLFIMAMTGGGGEPPPQEEGGQQSAGQKPAVATAAAPSSAAPSPAGKVRRGKRS